VLKGEEIISGLFEQHPLQNKRCLVSKEDDWIIASCENSFPANLHGPGDNCKKLIEFRNHHV